MRKSKFNETQIVGISQGVAELCIGTARNEQEGSASDLVIQKL